MLLILISIPDTIVKFPHIFELRCTVSGTRTVSAGRGWRPRARRRRPTRRPTGTTSPPAPRNPRTPRNLRTPRNPRNPRLRLTSTRLLTARISSARTDCDHSTSDTSENCYLIITTQSYD